MKLDNLRKLVKEELDKATKKDIEKATKTLNTGTLFQVKKFPQTEGTLIDYLTNNLSYEQAAELNTKVAEASGKTFPRIDINSPSADPRGFSDKLTTD